MNRDETLHQVIDEILVKTDGHPDVDELVAYHEGTLSPTEERRVQDHLVACRECAALAADLEGLGEPGFGAGEDLPEGAGDLVWEKVREEIRKEPAAQELPPPLPFRPRERGASPRWLQALAASLLAATVGLSYWVADLRGRNTEPRFNTPILDLYPVGSVRGEGGGELQTVPAGDVHLILHPPGSSRFAEHGAEIVDAAGREVWRKERDLELNADGSFTLWLPRKYLGLRLRLMGIDPGGGRELVAEYALPAEAP